tara:strand:+ start:1500 stop:1718 length:219 start_codon:yes stop_codon:yes gene_type:complete
LKILNNSLKIIIKKNINNKNKKIPPRFKEYIKIGTNIITENILLTNSILKRDLKFDKIILSTIISFSLEIIE